MIEKLKMLLKKNSKEEGEKEEIWPTEVQVFDKLEIKNMWGMSLEMHGDWPHVYFTSWGFLPERGDLILIPMETGKKVVARITEAKRQTDPEDMTISQVELLGYKDEDVDISQYKIKEHKIHGLIQI